jgi:hypothetical protein
VKSVRVLCLALIVGCKSEPTKLADLLERSSSWLATAAAVAQSTGSNRTPVRYADDTFDEARKELETAGGRLDALNVAPDIRADGKRLIESGTRTIDHLRLAIDRHARDIAHDVDLLSAQSDSLSDLSDKAKQAGK